MGGLRSLPLGDFVRHVHLYGMRLNPDLPLLQGEKAQNNLRFLFSTSERAGWEFAFCGYGEIRKDTLRLERISLPHIFKTTLDTVWWSPVTSTPEVGCDKFYVYPILGAGHGHVDPAQPKCGLSGADIAFIIVQDTKYHFLACADGTAVFNRRTIIALLKMQKDSEPP